MLEEEDSEISVSVTAWRVWVALESIPPGHLHSALTNAPVGPLATALGRPLLYKPAYMKHTPTGGFGATGHPASWCGIEVCG